MKIGIFEPYGGKHLQFEKMLEITQVLIDEGHDVIFLGCEGEMFSCQLNIHGDEKKCIVCRNDRIRGLSLIEGNFEYMPYYCNGARRKEIKKFASELSIENVEDLKNITFESFNVGIPVLSTLTSRLKTICFPIDEYKDIISNKIGTAIEIYLSMVTNIDKQKIDVLYVANGRHANQRAALAAAELAKIDFVTVESAPQLLKKYRLTKNSLPHDPRGKRELIENHWHKSELTENKKTTIGTSFFEKRLKKQYDIPRFNYTSSHKPKRLPQNFDFSKHNIAFFNSTTHEIEAIFNEFNLPTNNFQMHCLNDIAKEIWGKNDFHLYIRLHPNMVNANDNDTHEYLSMESSNVSIIQPWEDVDTYQLIKCCDKVVVFLSTVGIEAAYLNKPSIVLGTSHYGNLGSTYHPKTSKEAIQLLLDKQLKPLPQSGAIKYGFYMETYGIPYKYFHRTSYTDGSFKGVNLKDKQQENNNTGSSFFFKSFARIIHTFKKFK